MAEPYPAAVFDAAMARAGITLTEAERATLIDVSRHIAASTGRIRTERAVGVEPATLFVPGQRA
ncbi:hypothetical protein G3576_11885 [Roseomonas stagni]|uniref:Uncharacterized protein n=1 Tax=Falsiroseomonas algicola TaxID=2716930 RepID=A0A6M1LLI5_9PROT|nr:hypothetical protein [Falsiroseomonas algicola]NGM20714.1 hypothetical protein [Falsiroseomonas algicola]